MDKFYAYCWTFLLIINFILFFSGADASWFSLLLYNIVIVGREWVDYYVK